MINRKTLLISFLLATLFSFPACQKGPHNPYLDLKVKPSEEISRENGEVMKKGNKHYKRHMRKSKRKVQRRINKSLK